MTSSKQIKISDVIGKNYNDFWTTQKRYVFLFGGRASKKTKITTIRIVTRIMEQPLSNALVIRRFANTLRDSCMAELMWAIDRLGVTEHWEMSVSPLKLTYKPTGQVILFRGLDDGVKITSIAVPKGYLNIVWYEEFYECSNEDDFNKVDMSIRGNLPEGYFKQIIMTLNPWSDTFWGKERFFDNPPPNCFTKVTTYKDNEFLGKDDLEQFEYMRIHSPKRYSIEGEGNWGKTTGLVFTNYEVNSFDIDKIRQLSSVNSAFGLDWGYTNDPSTLCCSLIDDTAKTIWVFDEMYEKGMSNERIAETIKSKGYAKEKIICDSAEPKSIARLITLGIPRVKPANKGNDSIRAGIDFLQNYHIIIHPRCTNFIKEINNYAWDIDKHTGKPTNKPIDEFNHMIDALRYSMEQYMVKPQKIKATRTNY